MRALLWDGAAIQVVDHPTPTLGAGMALVRVHLAGICNTDLEITRGYMGFRGVLGHEFVGVVDDGPPEWRGLRVVGEINFACGACEYCSSGLQRHCPQRQVMGILNADGALAQMVAVPIVNLHRVPQDIADEAAVFTEPLAAAFEILAQVQVTAETSCVVLGDGKLGLLVAQALHHAGAQVLAVGKHPAKLAILQQRGIRTATIPQWKREPADLVVEATGSGAGLAEAIAVTRPRGTLVLKSTVADSIQLHLAPLIINEITVVGSRCGPFEPALRALKTDSINVRSMISGQCALADAIDALRLAATPGTLKILVDCQ